MIQPFRNETEKGEETNMDLMKIGKYIQSRRKAAGLTQKQLAQRLNVSFQAVSKWENGDTLPDAALLLDLADVLNTSTDQLLTGGTAILRERRRIRVQDVVEGFEHIEAIGRCFGEDSLFYIGMVDGINEKMNMDLIPYLRDPKTREALIAEVLIQGIMNGCTVDMDEVREAIHNPNMVRAIEGYLAKTDEPTETNLLVQSADGYRNARKLKAGTVVVVRKASGGIAMYDSDGSETAEQAILSAQTEPIREIVCCRHSGETDVPSERLTNGLIERFPENAQAIVWLRGSDGLSERTLSACR